MAERIPDPFKGVALTQQTPTRPGGRDQRLFGPTPLPAPATAEEPVQAPPSPTEQAEPTKVDTYKPRKVGTKEPRNIGSVAPETEPATGRFDFDERPSVQANILFTDDERDALEDLKTAAKRKYGLQTSKQDIARWALIDLLQDFDTHGEDSRFIQWLKRRNRRT